MKGIYRSIRDGMLHAVVFLFIFIVLLTGFQYISIIESKLFPVIDEVVMVENSYNEDDGSTSYVIWLSKLRECEANFDKIAIYTVKDNVKIRTNYRIGSRDPLNTPRPVGYNLLNLLYIYELPSPVENRGLAENEYFEFHMYYTCHKFWDIKNIIIPQVFDHITEASDYIRSKTQS